MSLGSQLDEYNKSVTAWLEQSKKENAAIHRLQRAVQDGNVRDLEKLRQAAQAASNASAQRAELCESFEFDAAQYLGSEGDFTSELKAAAEKAGVKMYEGESAIFCYPVLVRTEPGLSAVRIDKKLNPNIRPETLVADLKKLQSKEPKAKPDQFLETLFRGYQLLRAFDGIDSYIDRSLSRIYSEVLTLLPGHSRDYTLLDFTRDIYYVDTSNVSQTRDGFTRHFTASTVSRERGAKLLKFVTRDGHENTYASVKFSPPGNGA